MQQSMEMAFCGFPSALESMAQLISPARRVTTESDDAYIYSVALPGVDKESVSVDVDDNVLEIKAKTQELTLDERFTVPRNAVTRDLKAEIANGVLSITVPKCKEEAPHIVQVAEDGEFSEDGYRMTFQVPGASRDCVRLEVAKDMLKVSAKDNGQGHFSSFERAFQLPYDARRDGVQAICRNGILALNIGRQKPEKVPFVDDLGSDKNLYTISLQVPGIETQQISIDRLNRYFTLRISDGSDTSHPIYGHRFTVPTDVRAEEVVAAHKNGILTIAGPKVPKPRQQVAVE